LIVTDRIGAVTIAPNVGPLHGHRLLFDPVSAGASTELVIGDRTLLALSDGFLILESVQDFIGSPAEPTGAYDALKPIHGEVRLPLGCFVLPGEVNVLVDAGFGPVDAEGLGIMVGGNLLRQMAARGLAPDDIGILALSHLHLDHVGWLATAEGEPVFPNAQVHVGRADWDYFVEGDEANLPLAPHIRAALVTLAEDDRVTLLDDDRQIAPGVTRLAAPGHTPGHSLFAIHDRGERAVLFGDAMYCPQQLTNSDWAATSDVDPALARRTREAYLRDLEAHGGAGVGCHFPQLKAGRIISGAWREQ
jgi:glyoxylase-like metal-dependent hydrolase (beta-lactamase superfamily II)